MNILGLLQQSFGQLVSLEETAPGISRVYLPFFHEDGDMISIYLQSLDDGSFILRDFGNTIMRVSYTFEIDTDNKRNIIRSIIKSNYGKYDDGEIILESSEQNLIQSIFQFSQIVAKVSNVDIIRHEITKSMFSDYLSDFIYQNFRDYNLKSNISPTNDKQLVVDYSIGDKKPIYIFGVGENAKASRVVISCLTFQKYRIPFQSLVIHEDFDSLSVFNRNQITNAADKQYTSLDDFKIEGTEYIQRQIA